MAAAYTFEPVADGHVGVVGAAGDAPAPQEPSHQLVPRHLERDHRVEGPAPGHRRVVGVACLHEGPGIAVEDEAVGPVRPTQAGVDQLDHAVVGDELAAVHPPPGFEAERGALGHVGAEDVARGEVGDTVGPGQALALGPLACPGGSEEQGARSTSGVSGDRRRGCSESAASLARRDDDAPVLPSR